jgi:hypothetical protein
MRSVEMLKPLKAEIPKMLVYCHHSLLVIIATGGSGLGHANWR